jgi:hypothetical protein
MGEFTWSGSDATVGITLGNLSAGRDPQRSWVDRLIPDRGWRARL